MDCYVCKRFIQCTSLLWDHFKQNHALTKHSRFECTFGGTCDRKYYNFNTFLKHAKTHFAKKTLKEQSAIMKNQIKTSQATVSSYLHVETESEKLITFNSNECFEPVCAPRSLSLVISMQNPDERSCSRDIKVDFHNQCLNLAMQMHSQPNLSRKDVFSVQSSFSHITTNSILNQFERFVGENFGMDTQKRSDFEEFMEGLRDPFKLCDTEHKLIQTLKNRDLLCEFEVFDVHVGISGIQKNGGMAIGENKTTGVLLPIAFQFRKRFEQNDLLLKALTEMDSLSKACGVRNFLQGSLWKKKSRFYRESGKIAIPFFLYIDDSEINNALGSHVCPITFVYYSFPGIDFPQLTWHVYSRQKFIRNSAIVSV